MIDRPLIVIFEHEEYNKILEKIGQVRLVAKNEAYTEDELIKEISNASAIVISSKIKITRKIIESAPKLKIIAKCGGKPDNVDLDVATSHGIFVTWTPGSNPISVAEHTVALMLLLLKKVFPTMMALKEGKWIQRLVKASELMGKTVGLIGLGQVGYHVARLLQNFNCCILYFDPYVSKKRAKEVNAEEATLDYLLKESDIISLHCQLNSETRHMIAEPQLFSMKKTAHIVNTSRGALINEQDLLKALKEDRIAGAGLDVFEEEPVTLNNPLISLPNVVVTPHMAGVTFECFSRETQMFSEEVLRVLNGEPAINALNPECINLKKYK